MFYLIELYKELEVHPRFFGPKLREEIERRLRQEVRRASSGLAPPACLAPDFDMATLSTMLSACWTGGGHLQWQVWFHPVGHGRAGHGQGPDT